MKKWYAEDWRFTIEVLQVGQANEPKNCRLGFEVGDIFNCEYDCPAGFCPTTMIKLFTVLEVVRAGGDLRDLGGSAPAETNLICPDGVVTFNITGSRAGD
jgi:uncharacterized repeat protein (TIGR04076 family)